MQHIQHTGKEDQEDEVAKNGFAPHMPVWHVSPFYIRNWKQPVDCEQKGLDADVEICPHRCGLQAYKLGSIAGTAKNVLRNGCSWALSRSRHSGNDNTARCQS
jgi:hypothetical protein